MYKNYILDLQRKLQSSGEYKEANKLNSFLTKVAQEESSDDVSKIKWYLKNYPKRTAYILKNKFDIDPSSYMSQDEMSPGIMKEQSLDQDIQKFAQGITNVGIVASYLCHYHYFYFFMKTMGASSNRDNILALAELADGSKASHEFIDGQAGLSGLTTSPVATCPGMKDHIVRIKEVLAAGSLDYNDYLIYSNNTNESTFKGIDTLKGNWSGDTGSIDLGCKIPVIGDYGESYGHFTVYLEASSYVEDNKFHFFPHINCSTPTKPKPTPTDPCKDPAYAADNPKECGGTVKPKPNPCDDPTFKADNPSLCGGGTKPNPCDDPAFEKANPTLCGGTVKPNPCDDPAFEKANPTLCGGGGGGTVKPKKPRGSGGKYRYHQTSLKDVADNSKKAQLSYMTRDGDTQGSLGAIYKLQEMLKAAGESITPDGIYGPKTKAAIKSVTGQNGEYVDTSIYDIIMDKATLISGSNAYRQKTVLYNAGVSPREYNKLTRAEKKQVAQEIAEERGTGKAAERVRMWFRNKRNTMRGLL